MCPIWPLHLILFYILAFGPLWVLCQVAANLTVDFDPNPIQIHVDEELDMKFNLAGFADHGYQEGDTIQLVSDSEHRASVANATFILNNTDFENGFSRIFRLKGNFLGIANVTAEGKRGDTLLSKVYGYLRVVVIRPQRVIDTVFTVSVATLVALIFINFGCAMDWPTVLQAWKRPVGPAIGLAGQYGFMPVITYVLGLLIFPNDTDMRIGLFFTGVSPGGGASNIWTFLLGGNLNLSLAMTTISTLASFLLMPLWLFTLGRHIFQSDNIVMPYQNIITFVLGLFIPLGIGLAMQKFTPKISKFMVRILKGFSSLLLLFIIVFAIVTNLYIFELFSWQIIVAGMAVPWLGYSCAYIAARLLRQPHPDALAICIETGVVNTGISIFLLRFSLEQPAADLTTVVPVAVAIMTPFPMMTIYAIQQIMKCVNKHKHGKHHKISDEECPATPTPDAKDMPATPTPDFKDMPTTPTQDDRDMPVATISNGNK